MGSYLNPGSKGFQESLNSEIYVDKSGLIEKTNAVINTRQKFICVSRPRRFGKSMAADMLAAYYDRGEDTASLFDPLKISKTGSYQQHRNQYDVLKVNMQEFLSMTHSMDEMLTMLRHKFGTYWNQTETYEALKIYIQMDMDGLQDAVVRMPAGERVKINTGTFSNDMTTFSCKDDVLTLLVHLGYLTYDSSSETVTIPNKEVSQEYVNAISTMNWKGVMDSVDASRKLLEALWAMDADAVAAACVATPQLHQFSDVFLKRGLTKRCGGRREYADWCSSQSIKTDPADALYWPRSDCRVSLLESEQAHE